PYSWDVQDVQRWIMWLVKEKRLEYAAEHMHVFYKLSGAQLVTLCDNYQKMSTQQSPQLAPAQRIMIEAVCAHLDIWKSAAQTMSYATNMSATNTSNIKSNDDHGSNNVISNNNSRGNCHGQNLQIVSGLTSSGVSSQPKGCEQQLDEIDLLPYQLSQVTEYTQPPQHQHTQYSTVQQVMNPGQLSSGQTLKYSLATHEGNGLEMQLNSVSSNCNSVGYPVHSSPPLYVDLNEDTYSDGKVLRKSAFSNVEVEDFSW
ncbi:SAM pointed domain-containing Ets transcription factor-like, partial [Tropilaelaps mercedesae]